MSGAKREAGNANGIVDAARQSQAQNKPIEAQMEVMKHALFSKVRGCPLLPGAQPGRGLAAPRILVTYSSGELSD